MMNEQNLYQMPNLGCMLGTAYQRQLSELSEALADRGLDITTSEYLILRALYYSDGLQQCDISSMLGKDKAAISRCLSGMVKKGLIRIEAVSHKCQRAYLTEEGREIESTIMDIAHERHEVFTGLLTHDELRIFVGVLKKLIQK